MALTKQPVPRILTLCEEDLAFWAKFASHPAKFATALREMRQLSSGCEAPVIASWLPSGEIKVFLGSTDKAVRRRVKA
jgi:hypothetical protein